MASTITALTGGGGVAVAGDTSGVLELKTNNGTTAMTIDTSQNVGIGTNSPAQKLDVASKIQIDTSNSYGKIKIARATDSGVSALYIQGADNAGTANELSLVNAGGGGAAINITGGDIRFYATSNTTERMRIDSSGNVGVGTNSPTYPLDVAGFARGAIVHRVGTYTAGTTTPSVAGVTFLSITNSSPTTITNFTGAVQGQVIYLLFNDSNTTINRTNSYLSGGTNFVSTIGDTLVLLFNSPYWYEISRSINS